MDKRKCPKCGWIPGKGDNDRRCKLCGTLFEYRLCLYCHTVQKVYTENKPICRECYLARQRVNKTEVNRRWKIKRTKKRVDAYEAWLKRTRSAPFKALSEADWLEACRYFGGCALCNNVEISARGYFIPYTMGGRYTAWNILPLCEQCTLETKYQLNPWLRLDEYLNDSINSARGLGIKKVLTAAEYLERKLNESQSI